MVFDDGTEVKTTIEGYVAMTQNTLVRLQARRPHVARRSVFSGSRKYLRKSFKSEICWKPCEATFVSLNCLSWIKRICTMYLFCAPLLFSFFHQIRRNYLLQTLRWGTCQHKLCVSSVFWRSLSWIAHLAQWTQYLQINLSVHPLNAGFWKWPPSQINCPPLQ